MDIDQFLKNKHQEIYNEIYTKVKSEILTVVTEEEKKLNKGTSDKSKNERTKKLANRISTLRKDIEDVKIKLRGTKNASYKELLGRNIDTKRNQIRELERAMSGK